MTASLELRWEEIDAVDVDEVTALFAGALSERHGLHALDAIHLASALTVDDGQTVMVSWDADLRRAAEAEGLALSPA